MFPMIRHISEVLPFVENEKSFIVKWENGYTWIDYLSIIDKDVFNHPVRRECRGLKFDENGVIIGRPWHKFFNAGEIPENHVSKIDLSLPHMIREKVDGSMIHASLVRGDVCLMTRKGITGVALQAEALASTIPGFFDFCRNMLNAGMCPIFEYCGPSNRIVLPYDTDHFVFLGCRNLWNGQYIFSLDNTLYGGLQNHQLFRFPKILATPSSAETLVENIRTVRNEEGVVVAFANGHMIKMKGDDYVLRHRTKDSINLEKNVLSICLQDQSDDILPLLCDQDQHALIRYNRMVQESVNEWTNIFSNMLGYARQQIAINPGVDAFETDELKERFRKKMYVEFVNSENIPDCLKGTAFHIWNGDDVRESIISSLLKNCTTTQKLERMRVLFPITWDSIYNVMED